MMSPSVLCSPITKGNFILGGTTVTLQTASASVNVCHCAFDIAELSFFSQNAWLLCELFTVFDRGHWVLQTMRREKKHFLCINYLHNGHKKIIIIKNKEVLMAAGRTKAARGGFLDATCSWKTTLHPCRNRFCSVAAVDAVSSLTFLSDNSFLYPAAPRVSRVMSTSREGEADARPAWRTGGDETSIQHQIKENI